MKKYGVLYMITNKINNKVYIGVTKKNFNGRYSATGKGIERVFNYYIGNEKRNSYINVHLVSSIMKYGYEAFEIVEEFDVAYSEEELYEKEKFWIQYYDSTNYKNGYNRTIGGEVSFALKGEEHPLYNSITYYCEICGKTNTQNKAKYNRSKHHFCSQECKYKGESLFYSGENKINYSRKPVNCAYCKKTLKRCQSTIKQHNYCNRYCQKEHYKEINLGEKNPNYGKGQKIIGSNNGRARKVICLTTNEVFDCMLDGAEKYGIKYNSYIVANCTGQQKSAGKLADGTPLVWQYYGEK
jgi:hypothetical protein